MNTMHLLSAQGQATYGKENWLIAIKNTNSADFSFLLNLTWWRKVLTSPKLPRPQGNHWQLISQSPQGTVEGKCLQLWDPCSHKRMKVFKNHKILRRHSLRYVYDHHILILSLRLCFKHKRMWKHNLLLIWKSTSGHKNSAYVRINNENEFRANTIVILWNSSMKTVSIPG